MLEQLFSFLLFIAVVCLIAGLIKPSLFKRFVKRDITRKTLGITFGIAIVILFILEGATAPKITPAPKTAETPSISDQTGNVKETTPITPTPETKAPAPKAKTEPKATTITPAPTPTPTPAPVATATPQQPTISDRDKMLAIFKADAITKWGSDYEMVKYEIDKQTQAYDWIIQNASNSSILAFAKQKWGNDYSMVKYEYDGQLEAYNWINQQTAYPSIMAQAKQKWGKDYKMVEYEYNKQVEAYTSL